VAGRPAIADLKSDSGRRRVSIDTETLAILVGYKARQNEERLMLGVGWQDEGYVFTRPDGSPLNPDYLSKLAAKLIADAGVPHIRFHDIRHTHITHLLGAGVNIKVASARAGHSSTSFTLDKYAHVQDGMDATAASVAAGLIDAGDESNG
jgi:integrase